MQYLVNVIDYRSETETVSSSSLVLSFGQETPVRPSFQ